MDRHHVREYLFNMLRKENWLKNVVLKLVIKLFALTIWMSVIITVLSTRMLQHLLMVHHNNNNNQH
ncbi:hypothetical protein BLA29_007042 [Euroglyphus maynei]|uniref:Uncharacterized protein n=1 Tax=Euroglyphus maynei TaxID=6958 RepID=A0A1Y3BVW4_EURMA|nr:hypothetical protein BLA29_007042 [Euroglyphus maynei]